MTPPPGSVVEETPPGLEGRSERTTDSREGTATPRTGRPQRGDLRTWHSPGGTGLGLRKRVVQVVQWRLSRLGLFFLSIGIQSRKLKRKDLIPTYHFTTCVI